MSTPWGRMLMVAAVLVGVAGCAAGGTAPSPPAPTPPGPTPAAVSVPPGGVSLAQLGFRHAPAASVTVPSSARLVRRVDQENVLTASFDRPQPAELAGWLRARLPEAGFRVTAERADSLVFVGPGWSGAFTAEGGVSALTLRRDPPAPG